MKFLKLFEPFNIRDMEVPNRIVMPAMHLNLANNGFMTQALANFYIERAMGGTGLLIIGGCGIDHYGLGGPFMISLDNDDKIPGLTDFCDQVHKAQDGVKLCAQLYHNGRYSFEILIGEKPISSSAVYSRFSKATPREMTIEDIKREQQAFADAALRCKKAGFDAVEMISSAGYLMDQFMSPLVNKRKDEYGGSFENRMRFPLETIEAIRKAVGDDYIFGARIAGEDYMGPESLTFKDKPPVAKAYEKASIDFLNVTGGWHEAKVPQLIMNLPEGTYTYLAENIKKYVSIPVFASNRLLNPEIAERTLQAGKADAICIGRGLIADPYLPMKAKKGDLHDIMHCVSCNQGCFDNIFYLKPIACLRNARAAKEAKTVLKPLKQKKKVMIIGSGPTGLEAARVAAIRGHNVHLFEKKSEIGGLIRTISRPPGRHDFKKMIDDYIYWFLKLKITIHSNTEVTIDTVKEFNPDAILVATGARPIIIPIPGIDKKHVYWANDALDGDVPIGDNNVIIGGGATGVELAIHLAEYGALSPESFKFLTFYRQYHGLTIEDAFNMLYKGNKKVTILEMLPKAGRSLGKSTKWALLDKCDMLGVKIITSAKVTEIGDDFVNYVDGAGIEQRLDAIDSVYHATGVKPDNTLFQDIKSNGFKVKKLGDARNPATVMEAVASGYKWANSL